MLGAARTTTSIPTSGVLIDGKAQRDEKIKMGCSAYASVRRQVACVAKLLYCTYVDYIILLTVLIVHYSTIKSLTWPKDSDLSIDVAIHVLQYCTTVLIARIYVRTGGSWQGNGPKPLCVPAFFVRKVWGLLRVHVQYTLHLFDPLYWFSLYAKPMPLLAACPLTLLGGGAAAADGFVVASFFEYGIHRYIELSLWFRRVHLAARRPHTRSPSMARQ